MKHQSTNAGATSDEQQDPGAEQFTAVLEETIQALEAVGSLMEKMQNIVSRGGANDAAMFEELKKMASPGAEQKILEGLVELAGLMHGDGQASASEGATEQASPAGKSGRFHDLV